jgi:hypothetical protein
MIDSECVSIRHRESAVPAESTRERIVAEIAALRERVATLKGENARLQRGEDICSCGRSAHEAIGDPLQDHEASCSVYKEAYETLHAKSGDRSASVGEAQTSPEAEAETVAWNPVDLEGHPKCHHGMHTYEPCPKTATRYAHRPPLFLFLCDEHAGAISLETLPIAQAHTTADASALRARLAEQARALAQTREARIHPHDAVREFHEAFGVRLGGSWTDEDRRRLRRALICEEFKEYRDAEDADDAAATLDALVDLTYVIVGAALEYGWDFAGAFAAVHAANMAKLGPDGKPIMREDGKILKPEGWAPADLTPFLALATLSPPAPQREAR